MTLCPFFCLPFCKRRALLLSVMAHDYIHTLRSRAAAAGLSVRRWCFLAGIHQSTYYRWISNRSGPTLATLTKLEQAIPKPDEE